MKKVLDRLERWKKLGQTGKEGRDEETFNRLIV
jgi:hypothetical protein